MAPRDFLCARVFSPWCGWSLSDWRRLMQRHRGEVDARYRARALVATAFGVATSVLGRCEMVHYAHQLARVEIPPPIFLLGHWRSGTTLLHQLLACDPRLRAPSFAESLHPHTLFLGTPVLEMILGAVLPPDRAIDRVRRARRPRMNSRSPPSPAGSPISVGVPKKRTTSSAISVFARLPMKQSGGVGNAISQRS